MSDPLAKAALFIPAFFALTALCTCFQRRRAQRRGGWSYLTPGPYFWFGLASGLIVTAVATLVVASGRVARGSGLMFTSFFGGITLLLAAQALIEQVRWNRHRVERRTIFGRTITIGWFELARAGAELSGYIWISTFDGPRLRISPYDNGFDQLMYKIQRHLPRNGPPEEEELAELPVPAFAEAAARGRP